MMDRRSWPWKKKSSEKPVTTTDSSTATLSDSGGNNVDKDGNNNYVQISVESYAHLSELEDQVKILQEKLSSAETEMTNKDNAVKQHAKVAEEAISGWEKAEAESSALKHQLESVTLLKLTAEERASHLDGALKECMNQIRNIKEESEQKLRDVVFGKTKQWEKVKAELEAKLVDFEQELLRASAENAALSRSLQERSDTLMKISDEKMQADTEIEVLNSNIKSCEKEINSLKYELHVISKELEIRNEEKNMSIKSADAANKQHLEDVKKISKLEAECQRLRVLVRKKLPGPAALAQMKLEVENLGRDYGESRLRRSPAKNHSPPTAAHDFASESIHTLQKENEFLSARLLAIEEETNMLKEALSKRNSEFQDARSMFAKTGSKLRSVEARMLVLNQHKISSTPSIDISFGTTLSQNESNPPSFTSLSEDGIDEEGSYSESWTTALVSDLSQFKKEKVNEKYKNTETSNHLELMNDFQEMERLACLSAESDGTNTIIISHGVLDKTKTGSADATLFGEVLKDDAGKEQQLMPEKPESLHCANQKHSKGELAKNEVVSLLIKLQSRIASTFKFRDQEVDIGKVLDDIRHIVQDTQDEMPQHSVSYVIEESPSLDAFCYRKACPDDMDKATDIDISSKQDSISCTDDKHVLDQELKNAISDIQVFVLSLHKEVAEPQDRPSDVQGLREKIQQFTSHVKDILQSGKGLNDFVLILSRILSEASEMGLQMSFSMGNECESNISDCIDKVTLLENKVTQQEPRNENISGSSMALSHSSSHPQIEGPVCVNFEQRNTMQKLYLKEFEQMRLEKENIQIELSTCIESLEDTKIRLVETEQNLAELKSQLAVSQKSNSLCETQLKCMAESYKLLELHAQELEAEVNLLQKEVQTLNNELQEERRIHQDNLAKIRDLQEQIERNEKCLMSSDADIGIKAKQEKDIAAAAEKLAECQETILLLGRQLQALNPPAEQMHSSPNSRHLMNDNYSKDAPGPSGSYAQGMDPKLSHFVPGTETAPRTGGERISDGYNSQISCTSYSEASPFPRSPINTKHQKQRSSQPSSPTWSPNALPEKHGRGFSRFFSKGKGDN